MHKSEIYTAGELLSILSARQLRDGQVVFAGVGIPLLAATLAQRLRCPGLTILFEGGVIGAFEQDREAGTAEALRQRRGQQRDADPGEHHLPVLELARAQDREQLAGGVGL